jgi:hypothetical protein
VTPPTAEELALRAPPAGAPLSELQAWLVQVFRHQTALTSSQALGAAAALHVRASSRLSPSEQLELYRQQFWLRHTSALVEDFPGLTALLGQEAWEPLVESYLASRGSDIFALKNLGEHFPQHLRSVADELYLKAEFGRELLCQMADLEWAYVRAFDVEDAPSLDARKLASMPAHAWDKARFILCPSLTLLHLQYPLADLRRALRASPGSVNPHLYLRDEHYLVVHRHANSLFDKRISRTAFLLLQQFQAGVPLVPACEAVITQEPIAAQTLDQELTGWFTRWGQLGWIVAVEESSL